MNNLDDFLSFADNSHIVIADYESRKGYLEAMMVIREHDKSPLLDKWIADASQRLEVSRTLYEYALVAKKLPLDELRAIWLQIKELKQ
jgi:hypothetical protein